MPLLRFNRLEAIGRKRSVRIYVWRTDESEEELCAMLPPEYGYREAALERYSSPTRRVEWLAGRVLLHCMAGISSPVVYTAEGRPTLPNYPLHISFSHSGPFVALALGTEPLGIDLEIWGARALRLAPKYLDKDEQSLFCAMKLTPEAAAVLLWSAKESVYKRAGNSGTSLLEHIRLSVPKASHELHAEILQGESLVFSSSVAWVALPDFAFTIC